MPISDVRAGTVVRVPFPYTDGATRQHRPALVVSTGAVGDGGLLLWVVMVTSAANRRWASDVPIPDHAAAGLPAESVIRPAKIATIERERADSLGVVPDDVLAAVRDRIAATLGLT